MRILAVLFALIFLAACGPPHPTHPTKVDCRLDVETRFSATVDTTNAGTVRIQPGDDPCNRAGGSGVAAGNMNWMQREPTFVPTCMAAGTTPEQAASFCSRHFESTGRSVGTSAPPLTARPPSGRICDGTLRVESSLIAGTGGVPSLYPNQCLEGTTWPLLP